MGIIHCKNKGFPLFVRINIPGNLSQNHFIEPFCNNLPVKILHLKLQIIFQLLAVRHHICYRIIDWSSTSGLKYNTFLTELCLDNMWCIMIYQISVYYSRTVIIRIYRLPKYFCCMEGRGGSKGNFNRIKIINDCPVLTAKIILIAIKHFIFAHFLIQYIPSVCLIHDNTVVV